MAYSNTTLNGSSISLAHTLRSYDSGDSLNITYDTQHTNPYLYKPIRPTNSRLRPALPTVFLQLPGDDHRKSSPWAKQPRRQASYETFSSGTKEHLLVQELTDATGFVRNPSPAESANQPAMPSTANMHRFSTCLTGTSIVSLLDPGMMHLDQEKLGTKSTFALSGDGRSRISTSSDNDSSDSEGRLQDWSTPRIAKAPTLRISSKELPSLPSCSQGHVQYRPASSCSMYRDESDSLSAEDDSDILHIRAPDSEGRTVRHVAPHPRPSAASVKRRKMEIKAEKQAVKTAKLIEANLRIKLDNPKVKDSATTIDSIFGIGKEESKAHRCGYGGLGIAHDKRTWKATDDYQSLLRDTVRSSLYNLSPRSPQSMKRRFSSQGNTPSHSRNPSRSISSPQSLSEDSPSIPLRRRKEPPPPLDLSSLSAFHTKVQIKTAQRKFVSKSSKRKGEQDQHGGDSAHRRELSDFNDSHMARPKISRRITLKGILRSVRSISSMRSAQ